MLDLLPKLKGVRGQRRALLTLDEQAASFTNQILLKNGLNQRALLVGSSSIENTLERER